MRRVLTRHASRCSFAAKRVASSLSPSPCTALTDDESTVQQMVRNFARSVVGPKVAAMDQKERVFPEVLQGLFDNGLMGIETPSSLKGAGLSFFSSILTIEELARVDPSVAGMVDVQNTLVNTILTTYAAPPLRDSLLQRLASSEIGSFCLTEAVSGSDAFALQTTATPVTMGGIDGHALKGTKIFITNSREASIFLVMATIDLKKGYKGITCFAVDKNLPPPSGCGLLSVGRKENKLGIRASSTCEVHLDNVFVPNTHVVGEIGKGYKIAIEALNEGRIGIGALLLGLSQGAMDVAMPYVFERKQFGSLIGDFQGMQFQYAQASLDIHAARLLVYNAARKKLHGESFVEDAAMAKLFASQVAERVASKAVEWMGGVGFMRDVGVEKFYRDAKSGSIYEGTSNIQLHTLAKFVRDRYARA